MNHHQLLITSYLQALSGQPKPPATVRQYVADEALVQHIADVEAAFPSYEILIADMFAAGGKVVVRGEFRGTHQGPFAGVPATGKTVTAGLIIIYRIEGDRIVEHWMQFDLFLLLQQLTSAAVPQPA